MRTVNIVQDEDSPIGYIVYDAKTGKKIEGVVGITFKASESSPNYCFIWFKIGGTPVNVWSLNGVPAEDKVSHE